jgi:hypothetical protein
LRNSRVLKAFEELESSGGKHDLSVVLSNRIQNSVAAATW